MDLSHLNPPQRDAVTHASGPLLVLAGAGSGKTRVITHRIAHLLARGIPARAIAALTFTNKAAEEMRERIADLLGDKKRAAELTMGTFHSLGLRILREERAAMGFPRGFVIYDTADQLGVLRELLRRTGVPGRRFDVKAILTRISLAKNAFVAADDYQGNEADEYDEITAEIYPKYQRALRSFAAVDFDDLIVEPVRLFEREPEVGRRWREKFAHVLVDEFQDTNRAQLLMVQHLVADHENLCVVGDDDQSIYSWRGADPRNILDFDQIYPSAKTVKLEQNYRSTPIILDAANAVIAHNSDRHGKSLWSDRPRGESIVHAVAPDAETEARFVAEEIDRVREATHYRYSDIAVLYRSNKQTTLIEEELRTRRIPYVMYGGQQFFERKEVKDVIAYLRAALNPRDEISLRRIVNYPARGIGATTMDKLSQFSARERTPLWRAMERASELGDELRPAAWRAVHGFVETMHELTRELEYATDITQVVAWLIERLELISDIRSASPSLTAAQRRIDNLEALKRTLGRFQEKAGNLDRLAEFLRHLSLESKDDEEAAEPGNRVILTTLHGAKGLEFPVVFLIGVEEELLPHARTLMPIATDVADPEHCTDVSEERRLAYVGITRAKDKLYVSRCAYRRLRGKAVPRTPSRFLMEIPEDLTESRDVAAEAREIAPEDEVRNFFANFSFD